MKQEAPVFIKKLPNEKKVKDPIEESKVVPKNAIQSVLSEDDDQKYGKSDPTHMKCSKTQEMTEKEFIVGSEFNSPENLKQVAKENSIKLVPTAGDTRQVQFKSRVETIIDARIKPLVNDVAIMKDDVVIMKDDVAMLRKNQDWIISALKKLMQKEDIAEN
jgi:hypothetical protein